MKNGNLEINQLYILESTRTNRPYVTEDGSCYAFLHEGDARKKAEEIPDTRVSEPRFYNIQILCSTCYSAGADSVLVCTEDDETKLDMREEQLKPAAYNHMLNSVLSQIKQTQLTKYIYYLPKCKFIVPAKIQNDKEVMIFYSIAKHTVSELGSLYVAFSSLDEFILWASDVPGWQPLLVDYDGLKRIGGKTGVILNPFGNQFIISKEMFRDIEENEVKRRLEAESKEKEAEDKGSKK